MEKITLEFVFTVAIGCVCVGISIALWVNRGAWSPFVGRFVSTISGGWQSSIERARQQKAARERVYGYVGSGDLGSTSKAGSGGSGIVLPAHWNQTEADSSLDLEAGRESITLRQLTKNELIVTLAIQRKDNGEYLFTGNEIKSFVGGRAADVGDTIAAVRGKKETPPPPRSIARPPGGWPKSAH